MLFFGAFAKKATEVRQSLTLNFNFLCISLSCYLIKKIPEILAFNVLSSFRAIVKYFDFHIHSVLEKHYFDLVTLETTGYFSKTTNYGGVFC